MNRYRSWCSLLFGYDWVGIPLVYTQVPNTVHVIVMVAGTRGRESEIDFGCHSSGAIRFIYLFI